MAIINSANPGSKINILCLIYRVLRRSKSPKTTDELTTLCRPETLLRVKDQKKWFPGELKFWANENHQLWVINDNHGIELIYQTEQDSPSPYEIADVTTKALFALQISDIMKKTNENDIESLLRTLSCLSLIDRFQPLDSEILNKETLDNLLNEYLEPIHSLNDAEKPTLLEYGHFLGFLEPKMDGYILDPTRIISTNLPIIFSDKNRMTIQEFIHNLNKCIPVLDGGNYQEQVKVVMKKNGWKPGNESYVSKALSHALERLSYSKEIRIETIADDKNSMQIQLPDKKYHTISAVTYTGGQVDA